MQLVTAVPYFVWLLLSAILFAFGEFLSKKFALAPSVSMVGAVLVVYILGTLAWLPAILAKNQLSIVGAMWSLLSLIATILIGIVIFNEKLSTMGIVGLVLGLISVALLSLA